MRPLRFRSPYRPLVTTQEELEQLLAVGNESPSFEVKGPGRLSDPPYLAKIARAAMAMGNRRDGGVVCIGIDEVRMTSMLPGLDTDEANEWSDYDNVAAALAKYADPAVALTLHTYTLTSGARVVALDVEEFEAVPHVCKRSFPKVLQDGHTYVRPRGKPESVVVPNSAEMRALLDLATAKGVREFVRVAGGAGVLLGSAKPQAQLDYDSYAAERRAAWSDAGPVVFDILAWGHTDVAVRPTSYSAARVPPVDLDALVVDNTVRLRGWPVPFVDYASPLERHGAWLGQDIAQQGTPNQEAWRICGSGQFLHRRALHTDLSDSPDLRATARTATGAVAVWDVLLYMVEVAEFGARMAMALDVADISFDVDLSGIKGRQLIAGDRTRELSRDYLIAADTLNAHAAISSTDLLANARQVGVELAQQLFHQFGAKIPDRTLYDYQARILTSGV